MSPILHPLIDTFMLGFITACSLVATVFFLRFWVATRDLLFLAFAVFFLVQGGSHLLLTDFTHPNVGSVWLFLVRLLSNLGVLGVFAWKNFSNDR